MGNGLQSTGHWDNVELRCKGEYILKLLYISYVILFFMSAEFRAYWYFALEE